MAGKTILIVEDDGIISACLQDMLIRRGYTVPEPVGWGEEVMAAVETAHPDLVLMDIQLAGAMNGIAAAAQLRSVSDIPVIYLTAYSEDERLRGAKEAMPYGYLVKPVAPPSLFATIEMALYKHASDRELRRAKDELELRVRERTAELERTNSALREYAARLERLNKELGDFAFIAAHDLQEPLRKIQMFGSRIISRHKESLAQNVQDDLEKMAQCANRMSALIEALLHYSRVATRDRAFAPTDLAKVARSAVNDLKTVIEQTGARVEIGDLPVIEADVVQMHLLFVNFISNAIRYGRKDEKPVVRLYGCTDGQKCEICVEDNGIGFDEIFAERIFRPFQRLHSQKDYEGTGMGLAICRKIVEHHEGSITVRSIPGQGSTFIVTLPVAQS